MMSKKKKSYHKIKSHSWKRAASFYSNVYHQQFNAPTIEVLKSPSRDLGAFNGPPAVTPLKYRFWILKYLFCRPLSTISP